MDEEKTIDEAVDEKADEMKEFEPVAFDEVIKDEPVKESAPVLRALGDPEPADMNMIHKHVDNFLAKIAGETPIDDNVRNSTEYWLDKIAEWASGKSTDDASTKKIYWHTVYFERGGAYSSRVRGYMIIINNDPTLITSDDFIALLQTPGFVGVVLNGYGSSAAGTTFENTYQVTRMTANTSATVDISYIDTGDAMKEKTFSVTTASSWVNIQDLGANPIN